MKVLFLTHSAELGGGELSLLDLAKAFAHEAEVLFLSDGPALDKYKQNGIQFKVLKMPASISSLSKKSRFLKIIVALFAIPKFLLHLSRAMLPYDLLYTNSQKAHFFAFGSTVLTKKKWIVHYRDYLSKEDFGVLRLWISRFLLNHGPQLIIANSDTTKKALIEAGVKTPIDVVYNFISFHASKLTSKTNVKNDFVILYPSRFSYWKGQLEFLAALSYLKQKVRVALIYEEIFGEQVQVNIKDIQKRLPENVKLELLNFQKDMTGLFMESSLIVHVPVRPEPFGRVLLEAISYRKPLLVSKCATLDGFIRDNETGFVSDSWEPIRLATKIDWVIHNQSYFESITSNAYEKAQRIFSFENTIERNMKIIQQFLKISK